MVCRLCLIDADDNITIFGEEKIQKYIAKFLQLELSPEDPFSKVICARCWHQLDNFQNFCLEVEQAQRTLNASIVDSKQDLPATTENFDLLKKDIDDSDDDNRDNDELFFGLDEEIIKAVEVSCELTEIKTPTDPPETNENVPNRRQTRQSTIRKLETTDIPEIEPVKRKRGRPKKGEVKVKTEEPTEEEEKDVKTELNSTTEKDESTKQEEEEEEGKDDKTELNDLSTESSSKKRRGRPKKGEKVIPKIKGPKTESSAKMMQTAREFDEIIQKNMNLSCNICSVRLIDFAELKRHFRAVHQRRGYAVCCNKRLFKRGLVVDHINVHNNPEYFKCEKCGKILADRMCLRNHDLLFHQKEELKTFKCAFCPKKYAKQYLLDQHSVKHVSQDECTFFCAECGKGFPSNATLTKHVNQIHSTIYDKMCEICAKLIRGNANFDRHMEEHEGIVQPQVQCQECGSWLKDKNSLRKHMYKHDGKTYTCDVCGKVSQTKSSLQSHMRYVHEASRTFQCTFCDKSFKKSVILKEHMTQHTGEVLYTCPHCPKTFNSKANMHSHRKKKHREEWEANRRYPKKEMKNELSAEDPISKEICKLCWQQLEGFEKFSIRIEEAQKTLSQKGQTVAICDKNSIESLSHVKEEGQKLEDESSGDDSFDNADILPCLEHDDIVKLELHNEDENKLELLKNNSFEENENPPRRRITRQSTLNKTNCDNFSDKRRKRKTVTKANEDDKVKKTEDEEEIINNTGINCNTKTKTTLPRKSDAVDSKEKSPKSERFLKAMQTSKEFDEIIRKHMNLSCDICSIQLSDFAELKLHFRLVHKRRGYAVCCNKRLNKRGLFVDHINVHNNPEYFKCTECGKILSDRICLHKHIISFHQTEELKTFQCDYCPKKFAKQYLLDQHSVKHVPENEFTFICSECKKGFPTNATLKAHLKQVHTTMYDRMCEICAKLIRGKAAFKRHVEEHEGIVHPQVQCTQCGAWLKDKRNLRKHVVTQHLNDDKNYSCDVCGKKAPSKGALQSHMRYVHQLSRIFKCTFCEKSFKKTDHLKEHMATHTGEVLYTCPYCPTTFNSRCNMYAHRKKKHREEWEANRALSKKQQNTTQTKKEQD
ncbi:zinc finger protein 729-like [Eupeodes corollae]|uniref:zinc finger protein 729-like n=1 Tax=Eupeodes corollae TaxID=290404 RepID=UPI002493C5C4|nr:zinc finger protein 729-like [Eupeodes corollae]